MLSNPGTERYDTYEPNKYCLIAVDDVYTENLLEEFENNPCYWHTLCQPKTNLAYYGITLIPPESAGSFISVFRRHDNGQYKNILELFEQAQRNKQYIIHYGI